MAGTHEDRSDSIYYRDGASNPAAAWVMARARLNMYRVFCGFFDITPELSILDIGVSLVETNESNALERFYPHRSQLTCAGLGDGREFKERYPEVQYVRITAGTKLPFSDRQFDIAYSNAVLEHVGGRQERATFVSEALRVARAVFFAVPNRWFPIEHHTGIPLLHYSPSLFRRLLRDGSKAYWTDVRNLDFLSKTVLRQELGGLGNLRLKYCGLFLGPFSSNIAIVIKQE